MHRSRTSSSTCASDGGLAFVVVQHLSPDFKSLMQELLSRHTAMHVRKVEGTTPIEPNCVYLIPPKQDLNIDGRHLTLSEPEPRDAGPHHPIDHFFESLASALGERAIGVILSGTGTDGSRGVKAISMAGGFVLTQSPESAQFDGMPRSAISTGVINNVMAPSDIAATVNHIAAHGREWPEVDGDPAPEITTIIGILLQELKVDFSGYKHSTIHRRIERRRLMLSATSLAEYADVVARSPEERSALRNDLLITVTSFFRDAPAWRALRETHLPDLLRRLPPTEPLRIWVAACATGEEAYTLAIVIQEALANLGISKEFKIFATDVDTHSLEIASDGIYPPSIESEVPYPLIEKYFELLDGRYQVNRALREKIIFAAHNLATDAPFTRMNFVTCRNALIYMQPKLQNHVLRMLHFSLGQSGILFLGGAETAGDFAPEFNVLDSKWNIYEKIRDVRIPVETAAIPRRRDRGRVIVAQELTPPSALSPAQMRKETLQNETFRAFLRLTDAVCIVVDSSHSVLQVIGDARHYLRVPEGNITTEITKLVPSPLALPLTTALHRARSQEGPVVYSNFAFNHEDETRTTDLKVVRQAPTSLAAEYFIVVFSGARSASRPENDEVHYDQQSASTQRIRELEDELEHARENLQATIEELESTNEEQQATNEELLAANEELQSTNEELHSVNEELYTVNAEYQAKIQELSQLNTDLDNLLDSTNVGVIFLDDQLRIRKFTAASSVAVNLLPTDVGRPFEDLAFRFFYPDILTDVRRVLSLSERVEREAKLSNDVHLLVGLHPYQAGSELAQGVVVTFVDISELKRVEAALARVEKRYQRIFESNLIGIYVAEAFGSTIADANDAFLNLIGLTSGDLPIPSSAIFVDADEKATRDEIDSLRQLGHVGTVQRQLRRRDGQDVPVLLGRTVLDPDDGTIVAFALEGSRH